jgi:hypothetical protein
MRRAAALLLSLAPFAAACPSSGSVDGSVATSGHPTGGKPRTEVAVLVAISGMGQTVEAMVGVAARIEEKGGSRVPFVASPEASGGSSYEADTMLAVRHGVHEGYERVALVLDTGEEPTEAVPVWTLMSPKGDGLLRVTLPSITATGVSGGRFGDDLLKSFYVVRAPEGGMFVDVFARRAFPYRVLELSDPAQPVVDFRPSGSPSRRRCEGWRQHSARGARAGAWIDPSLTVSGYSRDFEASITVVLVDSRGEVVARQIVESNEWGETWRYFEVTLDLPPFSRRETLRVGAESAQDGTFEGVKVPVHGS